MVLCVADIIPQKVDNPSMATNRTHQHQQEVSNLKLKLDMYRSRLKRSRRQGTCRLTKATLVEELVNYLPRRALQFDKTQIDMAGRKAPTGYRWDDWIKSLGLQLKGISPKAYRLLRKFFRLPSFKTLTDLLNNINIRPGFHSAVLEALKERAKGMSDIEKMVVLSFDEMGWKRTYHTTPKKMN